MNNVVDTAREIANTIANHLTLATSLAQVLWAFGLVYYARTQAHMQLETYQVTKETLQDASQCLNHDSTLKNDIYLELKYTLTPIEQDIRDLQSQSRVQRERLNQCLRDIGDLQGILPMQKRLLQ